jgi:Na+-driven multidrug efflux pump
MQGVQTASRIGVAVAAGVGLMFVVFPEALLGLFGATDPAVRASASAAAVPGDFRILHHAGADLHRRTAGHRRYRSPLFITLASQIAVPIGMCTVIQMMRQLQPEDIWLAIVLGHFTRCVLTVARFRQGKWRTHQLSHRLFQTSST